MKLLSVALCLILFTFSAHAEEELTFGIASVISAEESYTLYNELSNLLSRTVKIPIKTVHRSSYAKMNTMITNGDVDFASVCTGALLHLEKKDYRLLVVPVVRGKATYQSYLIVHKDSGILSLNDLQGKSFAFTDTLSNSGALYPRFLVAKNGGKADTFFKKIYHTGSHDKSIFLVNRNIVDGAAVDSLIFQFLMENKPEEVEHIRVIHESPEFLAPPLVTDADIDPRVFGKLQNALVKLHETDEGARILSALKIDRFTVEDAAKLDSVYQMKSYLDAEEK